MLARIRHSGAALFRARHPASRWRHQRVQTGMWISMPSRFYAEKKDQSSTEENKGKTVKERVLEAAETIGLKKTDQEVQNPNQEKGIVETVTERVKSALESAKDRLTSERIAKDYVQTKEDVKEGAEEGTQAYDASKKAEQEHSTLEYAASAIGIDKEQQELARQAGHNMKEAAKDVYEGVKSAASGESTTTTTSSSHDSAESEQQGREDQTEPYNQRPEGKG